MESSGTAATTCSWNTQDFVSSRKSSDSGGTTRTCWMSTSTAVATTQLAKVGSTVASVMSFTGADRGEGNVLRRVYKGSVIDARMTRPYFSVALLSLCWMTVPVLLVMACVQLPNDTLCSFRDPCIPSFSFAKS